MGNRKLRKAAGKILKQQGYGKLYYGSRRQAMRFLSARELHRIIQLASYKPYDLFNDCDAFNHRFVRLIIFHKKFGMYTNRGNGRVFSANQIEMENGHWSCGCPSGPDVPWSVEKINAYHKYSEEEIADMKEYGNWSEKDQKRQDALESGKSICDEDGLPIRLE